MEQAMRTLNIDNRNELFNGSTIGAKELKASMKTNTIKGFLLTNGSLLAILAVLVFSGLLINHTQPTGNGMFGHSTTTVSPFPIPTGVDNPIVLPNDLGLPASTNFITEFFSGNTVAVPDVTITEGEFSDFNNLGVSLSATVGTRIDGSVIDQNGILDNNTNHPAVAANSSQNNTNVIPDEEELQILESEPMIDFPEFYQNLEYPEILKRAGVEGKVVVSLLIDEKGKVLKTVIKSSTNNQFNSAVINAVEKLTCKPGIQNGSSVKSWLMIPVVFKLK